MAQLSKPRQNNLATIAARPRPFRQRSIRTALEARTNHDKTIARALSYNVTMSPLTMAFSRCTEPVFGNARFRTALEVRKKPRENNLATVNLKCHGEPVEPWPLAAHVVFETALPITLQNATRSAAFRLQLPSGLPEGTRLLRLDAASKPGQITSQPTSCQTPFGTIQFESIQTTRLLRLCSL